MILVNNTMFRFLCVGALNTILGYACYAVLLFIKTPYLIALLLSTIFGVTFNYCSYGRLAFRNRGGRIVFVKFFFTYISVYCINAVSLKLLTIDFHMTPYFGQVICLPLSVYLSWLLMNYWVYKNNGCEYET